MYFVFVNAKTRQIIRGFKGSNAMVIDFFGSNVPDIRLNNKFTCNNVFHLHFELVSWLLVLEATEPISEPVTQIVVELIYIHFISFQYSKRDNCKSYILFHPQQSNFEMMLK